MRQVTSILIGVHVSSIYGKADYLGETPKQYLLAIADRTRKLIDKTGSTSPPTSSEHKLLLEKYEQVIDVLVPEDKDLQRPTLWHTDLNARNIFISPTGHPSLNSIIDWQSTQILPLYLQAQLPLFLEDDIHISDDTASQDLELKKFKDSRAARDAWVHKVYAVGTRAYNPLLLKALSFPHRSLLSDAIYYAGQIGNDSIHPFRETLIKLYNSWERISPYPPPFSFTLEEQRQHQDKYNEWVSDARGKKGLEEQIGIRHDGWVPTDEFENAKKLNEDLKKAFVTTAPPGLEEEYNKKWPFQSTADILVKNRRTGSGD